MNKQRIASLLAQGIKPTDVASIVGCTPSYLTQLAKDPEFQHILSETQTNTSVQVAEEEHLNDKYVVAEHRALDAVVSNLSLMEPREQIKALEVISKRQTERQKTSALAKAASENNNQPRIVVQLNMPSHAIPEMTLSANNEVVSIGNRALAPMDSRSVEAMFHRKQIEDSKPITIEDL